MKKMNKRGFTLIEMLVVVAVIAVLVSIIIPMVTLASDKAAAAADAANLRSAKATIAIGMLDGTYSDGDTITAEMVGVPAVSNYEGEAFQASIANGEISVAYGEMDITYLADIADNGKDDESNAASQTVPTDSVPTEAAPG